MWQLFFRKIPDMENKLVYSTEFGKMCPGCEKPVKNCICKKKENLNFGDGIIKIKKDKKGRRGKIVILISNIPLDENGRKKLLKDLKKRFGTGGAYKNGIVEIQGDIEVQISKELIKRGFKVK
jgi:translation initiation factor 1